MAAFNKGRVWLGTLVGGLVWNVFSMAIQFGILSKRYAPEQGYGHLLAAPRYSFFPVAWIATLFVLAGFVTVLYASVRTTCGPGPKTALAIGMMVGFAAGFPGNFATATWSPISRALPLFWMIEMWGGAILAALTAGWLYRD